MKACKNNRYAIIFFLVMGVLIISIPGISANPATGITMPDQTPLSGYYVIHWPEKNAELYFGNQFMGKIQNDSLKIPITTNMQKFSRYSIVSNNQTLFSDTLPSAPVSGEYVEIFPRWIQVRQPGSLTNETVRTYQIYWPDNEVRVYIDGEFRGTILNGNCRIEIPGRNIPGHPEYPKMISFRYPDGGREVSFSVDKIPEVGGVTEYYLYWSSPNMYPDEPHREKEQKNIPGPLWGDRFDASDLDISLSSSGRYGAIGTRDTGIARMYTSEGDVLWSYHDPEKTLLVSVSEDGNYCAIASRKDAWTVEESQGEILLAGRNGTILWKKELDQGANSVEISPDGSSVLVTTGQMMKIFDQKGDQVNKNPIRYTWSWPVSADGKWIVMPGTESIQYISSNGTQIWSYPVTGRILGISLSSDGNSGAAISDDHLYFFTREGEVIWQKASKYRLSAVEMSGDGRNVAASSQYRLLYYNNFGNLLWQKEHSGYVQDVSVSYNGNVIAALFEPGHLLLFDPAGNKTWDYQLPETAPALSNMVMSDNGGFVAVSEGGRLNYFNQWGNATIINEEENRDSSLPIVLSTNNQTKTTPAPSSFSVLPLLGALIFGAAIIYCRRKV